MPLLDHFRPPLTNDFGWENFHGDWITMIVQRLNTAQLFKSHFARGTSHIGSEVEVDVATLERIAFNGSGTRTRGGQGGVATQERKYVAPEAILSGAVAFAEEELFEVQVLSRERGNKLVAAVELVSVSNKDRPAKRRIFASKVASYLAKGVSVVVIDVITTRLMGLHEELIDLLSLPEAFVWESSTHLSAIAYRMIRSDAETRLEVWPHELRLGEELPTLPLWLAADLAVPLELELTYVATCAGLGLE